MVSDVAVAKTGLNKADALDATSQALQSDSQPILIAQNFNPNDMRGYGQRGVQTPVPAMEYRQGPMMASPGSMEQGPQGQQGPFGMDEFGPYMLDRNGQKQYMGNQPKECDKSTLPTVPATDEANQAYWKAQAAKHYANGVPDSAAPPWVTDSYWRNQQNIYDSRTQHRNADVASHWDHNQFDRENHTQDIHDRKHARWSDNLRTVGGLAVQGTYAAGWLTGMIRSTGRYGYHGGNMGMFNRGGFGGGYGGGWGGGYGGGWVGGYGGGWNGGYNNGRCGNFRIQPYPYNNPYNNPYGGRCGY